jgi:deoxyhypusine synthase
VDRWDEETVFAEDPKAKGYLRPREGYRLFEQREELCRRLMDDVRANADWLSRSVEYSLGPEPDRQG